MRSAMILFLTTLMLVVACELEESPVDPFQDYPVDSTEICFTRDVLPIFLTKCAFSGCHDSKTRADGYDLSSYAAIMNSKPGKGIVPGNPRRSEIYESLITTEKDDRMPPDPYDPLPDEEILTIRQWILQGARNTECTPIQCDTIDLRYHRDIAPILQRYCIGCHSSNNPSGNIALDTYTAVKAVAASGQLYGAIAHLSGYKPMPPNNQLDPCSIAKIRNWITDGMPEKTLFLSHGNTP